MTRLSQGIMAMVLSLGFVVSLAGCEVVEQFMPGDPDTPDPVSIYVVNRGGHYFVGDRCGIGLVEVGFFVGRLENSWDDPEFFDTAVWHATADSAVTEFELFATDQEGVRVMGDNGVRPVSGEITIVTSDVRGTRQLVWTSAFELLTDGKVTSPDGAVPWDDFISMPDSGFGC